MNKSIIWVWLSLLFGEGSPIYKMLISHFKTEEDIYYCEDADLAGILWLTDSQKYKLLDKNLSRTYEILEWCKENGVDVITYADDNYPEKLRDIEDFPAVLYCYGNMPNLKGRPVIGVVGTRKMTVKGERNARDIGYGLSKGGACVVSGMALGIDGTAQMGTLLANGVTIAVLGSGINVIYPKSNRGLYAAIVKRGAVITEYTPDTPPNARNFPVRNRIISGICDGIVVVEGDENSGAMITARRAKKQKRDIFAVPGPAGEFSSSGPNKLIKDGAILAESAVDILEQYLDKYADTINIKGAKEKYRSKEGILDVASVNVDSDAFYKHGSEDEPHTKRKYLGLFKDKYKNEEQKAKKVKDKKTKKEDRKEIIENDVEEAIAKPDMSLLDDTSKLVYESMQKDKLITEDELLSTGLPISKVSSSLTLLSSLGFIESRPGGCYIKK